MNPLSSEAISEYQEVYKKIHRKQITFEEARVQANELINLFQIIYRPIPKSWVNKGQKAGDK